MKILVVKEKYGTFYMKPTWKNIVSIIAERYNAGWYDDLDDGWIKQILKDKDITGALEFLGSRSDYEYEYVSLESVIE